MPTNQEGFSSMKQLSQDEMNELLKAKEPLLSEPNQAMRQLTFGEKLVGLNFNPSNDDKVSKAKRLCADLADLLHEDQRNSETSELKKVLLPATYAEILNAQMNVVKVLTLKY